MATSQCPLNYKMKEIDIKVPNIGDFTDVEVIEVLVNEGQDILKNDPLITIESDKSSVEIPSNFEGKVKSLKLKVGDKVSEGDLILILESLSSESKIKEETKSKKQSEPIVEIKQATEQISISEKKIKDISSASPKARKFARELGVNINQVVGSEKDGRVIEDDIKKFVSSKSANNYQAKEIKPIKIKNEYEHADFGKVEIKDIPRVKKLASTCLLYTSPSPRDVEESGLACCG